MVFKKLDVYKRQVKHNCSGNELFHVANAVGTLYASGNGNWKLGFGYFDSVWSRSNLDGDFAGKSGKWTDGTSL